MYIHVHVYVNVYTCTYICKCIFIYIYTCVLHVCTCICSFTFNLVFLLIFIFLKSQGRSDFFHSCFNDIMKYLCVCVCVWLCIIHNDHHSTIQYNLVVDCNLLPSKIPFLIWSLTYITHYDNEIVQQWYNIY